MYREYFKGIVKLVGQGIFKANYIILSNYSEIKVKNSTHIRLVDNQFNLPPGLVFEILAPLSAITIISGHLPPENVIYMMDEDYVFTRKMYQGL